METSRKEPGPWPWQSVDNEAEASFGGLVVEPRLQRTRQWNWEQRRCSDPECLEAELGGANTPTEASPVKPSGNIAATPVGRPICHFHAAPLPQGFSTRVELGRLSYIQAENLPQRSNNRGNSAHSDGWQSGLPECCCLFVHTVSGNVLGRRMVGFRQDG